MKTNINKKKKKDQKNNTDEMPQDKNFFLNRSCLPGLKRTLNQSRHLLRDFIVLPHGRTVHNASYVHDKVGHKCKEKQHSHSPPPNLGERFKRHRTVSL